MLQFENFIINFGKRKIKIITDDLGKSYLAGKAFIV